MSEPSAGAPAPAPGRRTAAPVAAAWLLAGLAFVVSCGWLGLVEPTETRYAEIAREMTAGRDWLVPRLIGIPHFHKPPAAYWSAALGMAALGRNEWGARLGVALAAVFTLWCVARLARILTPPETRTHATRLAPLVAASSLLFFGLFHVLASDAFLAAAVAGFHAAYADPRTRRGLWPFVALAAGFMAKGPVVFVPTLVPAVAAALWVRQADRLRPLGRARGWLLFAALALPWYLLVIARTPGLLGYFLGSQLWQRYATTAHNRPGPVYYFVPVLLAGALPWTWASLVGAARAMRGSADHGGRLLVCWVALPLLFFSTSGSKLPAYLLPIFPAVALLAASALQPGRGSIPGAPTRGRAAAAGTSVLLIGLAAALESAGPHVLARISSGGLDGRVALPPGLHMAAAALALAGILAFARRPVAAAGLVLAGLLSLTWGARPYEAAIGSPQQMAATLAAERREGEPIVEYARVNAGLPFYLGERVWLFEVPRELEFAEPHARDAALLSPRHLVAVVRQRGRAWVLGPSGPTGRRMQALGLRWQPRLVWRDQVLGFVTP